MNPQYQNQVHSSPSPVLGIVSLALGAIGLAMMIPTLLFWFCGVFPFLLGIASVIVGFLGLSRVKRDPSKYGGKVLAICGVVAGVLAIIATSGWTLLNIGLIAYQFS